MKIPMAPAKVNRKGKAAISGGRALRDRRAAS